MRNRQKIVVFNSGNYPIGSWSQRIRMMYYGFLKNNISLKYIVTFPSPDYESVAHSEPFVHFSLKPVKKRRKRNIWAIFYKIIGTYRGYLELVSDPDIGFVLLPGLDYFQGIFVKHFSKKYNVKYYAEIGDENTKKYSEDNLNFVEWLAMKNQCFYEKKILKDADRIYVVSSYLYGKYSNMFPDKQIIYSIPSFIDLDQYDSLSHTDIHDLNMEDLLKEDTCKILYTGSCTRTNGIEFFLKAYAGIVNNISIESQVIFCISHGDENKIRVLSKKLGIENNVKIYKSVFPKYIPAIIKCADILLLPEHGDVVANAGFPGKTAEYLASGKAIIATEFSDIGKYLIHDENCMISELGDMQAYMKNLYVLVNEPEVRARIGKQARLTALLNFDAVKAVRKYL